jgi:NADH-quinone oxidoreductase subunit F
VGRSFCALGDGAASPIISGIKYFRQEFLDLCAKQPAYGRPQQINPGSKVGLAGSHR